MNKDFDNNIPDFTARKRVLKIILLLLAISLIILSVQLYFKDSLSFMQGNFAVINAFFSFTLLLMYIILTLNMNITIKRIKEREKVEVPNEFKVDALKQTYFIFLYIFVLLMALTFIFASIITYQHIIMTLFAIIIVIVVSSFIYRMIKSRKFSLEVKNRNIKILYKNQEIGNFEIDNIAFVAFFGRAKKGDYPTMSICNFKGEAFLTMPLSLRNYWLMKKYFWKYNVEIEDSYNLI